VLGETYVAEITSLDITTKKWIILRNLMIGCNYACFAVYFLAILFLVPFSLMVKKLTKGDKVCPLLLFLPILKPTSSSR